MPGNLDGLPAVLQVSLVPPLTEAERRTLEALRNGRTTREAAAELFISQDTVKYRLKSIYRKFQSADRADILYRAERAGLLRR
ncbi:response regulator transcription factor [Rhodococcus sp. TAF43]|uniref:response regulator transcription factor n=1 Tax=Rhodococcus sp. TAF43 TaxID=3237483 RepID=UPI0015821C0E|nr:helix-turn-helix transcriptional regulator [Rhodococcus sp. W8901]